MQTNPLVRYLTPLTQSDLREKMVFVGGPRQVGKTTYALSFLDPPLKTNPAYLNWDIARHKKPLREGHMPVGAPLVILDEVHKYARWRNLLKGLYDEFFPSQNFLVTGSARLDHYRRGGDSLLGRYHYQRLHPISLPELGKRATLQDANDLLRFSGFPEPFFRARETFVRRWRRERLSRVLREDLRDLENVRDVSLLDVLLDALPERVGSPLSIRSLQEDLQVAHETIARWLTLFENVYLTYRISPYGTSRIRSVKKEQKLYFWDWSIVDNPGARFENMVASTLLKFCHFMEDSEGFRMELRYVRDRNGREVDFVVMKEKNAMFAVECKTGESSLSPHVSYFAERLDIPRYYQVHLGKADYEKRNYKARLLPFPAFCREIEAV